jgi:hypothetical protein
LLYIADVESEKLKEYDFRTANVVLITSVPGYHKGSSLNNYGYDLQVFFSNSIQLLILVYENRHMKVRKILKKEILDEKFKDVPVVCQVKVIVTQLNQIAITCIIMKASSMGSLTEKWLLKELRESFLSCATSEHSAKPEKTEEKQSSKKKQKTEKYVYCIIGRLD